MTNIMNKTDESFVVITTPSLSSHQPIDIVGLADAFIPADVYRRFSNLNGTPAIIIGGMNYFSQQGLRYSFLHQ